MCPSKQPRLKPNTNSREITTTDTPTDQKPKVSHRKLIKKIIVNQTSGLGNQLFQYAAGIYYAQKYGAQLQVAIARKQNQTFKGNPRPFLLGHFSVTAHLRPINTMDRLALSTSPKLTLASRMIRSARKIDVLREPYEARMSYKEMQIAEGAKIAYLVGYWQAFPIVAAIETPLRSEFQFSKEQKGKNLEMAKTIASASNPISIHIRRGDYIPTFGPSSILPLSYYDRAVREMTDRFTCPTFFVFSDDVKSAKAWRGDNNNFIFVDHNDATNSHEDLRLMSQCRHHIIANSTFSWWGAWMNPRQDKHVILPSRWLEFDTKLTDIAPPTWHLLDAN